MISVEEPEAGFYRIRMVMGGPMAGVHLWYGQPEDPITGELMDRSLRWQAKLNDRMIDLDRVWPKCAGDPIAETEYRFFCDSQAWALENDVNDPMAAPTKRVDWSTATPPSF